MTHRPFLPIPGRQRRSGLRPFIMRPCRINPGNHEIEISRRTHRKGQRRAHGPPIAQQSDRGYETTLPVSTPIVSHHQCPRRPGCRPKCRDVGALSAASSLKRTGGEQHTRPARCRCIGSIHPASIADSGSTRRYSAAPCTHSACPHTSSEEHEVIKISQLMVLSSRISVILEISGRSKDGHTRPQQWQADMDIRWKLRHRRLSGGSVGQDGLGRVTVGDPDPPRTPRYDRRASDVRV